MDNTLIAHIILHVIHSQVELVKISPQPGQNCHQAENWHRCSLGYTELPKKRPHRFGHRKLLFRTVKNRPCPEKMSKKKLSKPSSIIHRWKGFFVLNNFFAYSFS